MQNMKTGEGRTSGLRRAARSFLRDGGPAGRLDRRGTITGIPLNLYPIWSVQKPFTRRYSVSYFRAVSLVRADLLFPFRAHFRRPGLRVEGAWGGGGERCPVKRPTAVILKKAAVSGPFGWADAFGQSLCGGPFFRHSGICFLRLGVFIRF